MSIGAEAGAKGITIELNLMTQQLLLLSEQIEQAKHILQDLLLSIPESRCILSIQGVGYVAAAGILAETGPLQAYRNAGQLIKLAGTNPTVWESAGKRHSITHMSKKGRPKLRSCLWIAAISLLRSNPDFKEWARVRRERELHMHPLKPRETVGAVANRLLRIVYALVKNGSMYCLPQTNEVLV
jgi:transposase